MKNVYIAFLVGFIMAIFTGCASPRTKWTDPAMRVAVATDNGNAYAEIQTALMENGRFFVVDRQGGFQVALVEQEFNQSDRVDPKERFAKIGKMYGVGGVIVAHVACVSHMTFFSGVSSPSADCTEHLSLISTTTGQVIASSRAIVNTPVDMVWNRPPVPSWEEAVQNLEDKMPTHFEKPQWSGLAEEYRKAE